LFAAERFAPAPAVFARAASLMQPGHTDTVAEGKAFDACADCRNCSCNFVTENQREFRRAFEHVPFA
jgi:hypothetical protein